MKRYRDLLTFFDKTGTTQEELAARVGISQAHLSMILNGQRKPSIDVALRLEEETGVPVRALVGAA